MNFNLFKSEPKLAFPRCEHRSPSGRQCSQPVCSTDPRFCGTHKPTPEQPCPESSRRVATVELTEAAGTLSSPEEVHRFLKAVLLNRVRGRITPKEAAVYSYLCQNLLRSLREIDHFQELQSEREERNRPSTWNVPTGLRPDELWRLPRPDRSEPARRSLGEGGSSTSKTPPPTFDPHHFYPLDPTLPRGAQDHSRNIPLPTKPNAAASPPAAASFSPAAPPLPAPSDDPHSTIPNSSANSACPERFL